MGQTPPLFAVVGDVHAHLGHLERVLARVVQAGADAILLVGDLACAGHRYQRSAVTEATYLCDVAGVMKRVRDVGLPVRYVPGNHDLPTLSEPGNLDGRMEEICGLRVAGIGGAGPDIFGFPYEWDEDQIDQLDLPDCDILLAHCPPRNTPLDRTRYGHHVGSEAIRSRAFNSSVLVCGHIHEAAGVFQLGDCICLNAGGLGMPFGRAQVGFVQGTRKVWLEDLERGDQVQLVRGAA